MNLDSLAPPDMRGLRARLHSESQASITKIPAPDPMLTPDQRTVFFSLTGLLIERRRLQRFMLFPLTGNIIFNSWLMLQHDFFTENRLQLWSGHLASVRQMQKDCITVYTGFGVLAEDFEGLPLTWPAKLKF